MRPENVLSYLDAQPFRRFRLVMNSGRSFEVRHPEMVRVGRDVLLYFYADPPDAPFERWDTLALRLIEKIEFLDVPAGTTETKTGEG
jgi:hypothetical protein